MTDGVITLDQALGRAPPSASPSPGNSSTPAAKGPEVISLAEALGRKPAAPVESKPGFAVRGATRAFDSAKDFWTAFSEDVGKQQASGIAAMKEGKGLLSEDRQPFHAAGGLGEVILGAFQWSMAGPSALWDQSVTRALHSEARAVAGVGGKILPEKSENPWVVTKGDLARGSDALADFTDSVLQVSTGGFGAAKALPKSALELLPKELRAEFLARPARDSARIETAFDELLATSPDDAKHVGDAVTAFSPEMKKIFDKKYAKFVNASEKDLNKIGSDAAEQNIAEIEGKLPDISKLPKKQPDPALKRAGPAKPLEQGVSPDQHEVEDAQRHAEMLKRYPQWKPKEPELSPKEAVLMQGIPDKIAIAELDRLLQRNEAIAKESSKALERASIEKPSLGQHLLATNKLHLANEGFIYSMAKEGAPASSTHTILDIFIKNSDGATKDILERLRKFVPNIKVSFHDSLPIEVDGVTHEAGGTYHSGRNDIRINRSLYKEGLNVAQVLMHEMTHAATTRILDMFDFQQKGELENLLKIARDRFDSMPIYKGKDRFYGLKDIHEMLAETVSNPKFQQFLMASEHAGVDSGSKWHNLFDAIVEKIAKAIGLKSETMPLFHSIMKTGQEVMQLQKDHASMIGEAFGERPHLPSEFDFVSRPKATEIAKGKIEKYWDSILRNFAPEALSKQAKLGGAYIAKGIAGLAHEDSVQVHKSFERKLFWARNKDKAKDFISRFEKGASQATPALTRVAQAYETWARKIVEQDRAAGVKSYEAIDHYIPRVFENPEEVQRYLENTFGASWRAPSFTKGRGYEYLDQAIKAGFKPKFDNIEDMFLARQHASDVARMKLEIFSDLKENGLAAEKTKGKPPGPLWHTRPAPDGKSYWVHPDVHQILFNAFDSKSLWAAEGTGGDVFRAAMGMKNALIPLKLFGSLFHPLHVATIHNATELTRASASMLAGSDTPVKWLGRMVKGAVPLYHSVADTPAGYRLLQAFKGNLKGVNKNDLESLKLMQEGGFIPEMSSQYRTRSIEKFRLALAEGRATAAWHLPWAGLQLLQKPIFEKWIPSLKISSYLKDAAEWQKRNPTASAQERIQALRKLSKSIDNRYGEMAYNTLFWKRYLKDIAVADTLSLGWNLGFVREYGGGLLDVGQTIRGGSLTGAAKSGLLDRPLFVALYTTQALAYGGLMTWAMTGTPPKGWMDYIYPRTGGKTPDGKDARSQTMFYTREFGALYKHSQAEGPAAGIAETVWNKGSGLMSLATEAIKGVNEWGEQIRDHNAPLYKQVEQSLSYTLKELEPISLSAVKGPIGANKETALAVSGFTPAGKYISQSPTQARIDATYSKTYAPRETPYDKAQYSAESRDLRKYFETDQMDKFDSTLADMQEKYNLTGAETRKLMRGIQKGEDPTIRKFAEFSEGDQKAFLDKMSPEERDTYLKHAKKKVKRNYEEPVE